MKRTLILLLLAVSAISCSRKETSDTNGFDFGKGKYEEPFRGILKGKPEILVKSLRYIPFKWLAPDTVYLHKSFIIEFNEDAVRSGSQATITFVDDDYKHIGTHTFYANGQALTDNGFTVIADSLEKVVHVSCKIDPSVREKVSGKILLKTEELDLVNSTAIQQQVTDLCGWTMEQEYNRPWIIWFLWLLTALLACIIAAVILFFVCKWLFAFIKLLGNRSESHDCPEEFSNSSYPLPNKIKTTNVSNVMNTKNQQTIIKTILLLEKHLYSSAGIADKYDTLEKIRMILDQLYEVDQKKYQTCQQKLRKNTWDALENAWKLWDPTPNDGLNGEWSGINNMTYTLKELNPYYPRCKSKDFIKCTYDLHGSPDFDKVTIRDSVVNIEDLYETLTIEALTKRGGGPNSLQELAQQRMSVKLEPIIKQWARDKGVTYDPYDSFYKWRDENDLVPHEDTNCRTMRLVYRPAHKAFTHRGGIANAKNIKEHFMQD
jgi:hypothetical protein